MSDVQIAPGWYDDPTRADGLRWFDGQAWTEHVSARPEPAAAAEPDSPASPASTSAGASAHPRGKATRGGGLFSVGAGGCKAGSCDKTVQFTR